MIKLTNLLKEIKVTPHGGYFQNIQQLADRINLHPGYKTELINAVYNDAELSDGWSSIKSDIINGETEILGDDLLGMWSGDDGVLISLEGNDEDIQGSVTLNGTTLYYGFL